MRDHRVGMLFGMLVGFAIAITTTYIIRDSEHVDRIDKIEDILMIIVEHDSIQVSHIIDLYKKEL